MASPMLQLAAAVLVACTTYLVFSRRRVARLRTQNGCRNPPRYAHKDPIFGLDLFFRNGNAYEHNTYLEVLTDMYHRYGNTFEAIDMGKRSIYTIEPENLKSIFTTNSASWGIEPIRLAAMEPFCGRGFLTVDGSIWHKSRKMFLPSFEKKAIADFSAIGQFTDDMLTKVPTDGKSVDMQPLLSSLFIDATTLFLFGESFGSLHGSTTSRDVSAAFEQAMFGSGMRIALGPLGFLAKTRKWLNACRRAQSFAEVYVRRALDFRNQGSESAHLEESKLKQNVLLHSLAQQTEDQEHLRNEVLQAFFVSQGTTANCVSNVIFLVARVPGLWQTLRDETLPLLGASSAPTYEQLQRLPKLHNVVNEALRLLSVLPQNNRAALKDTTLPTGGGPDGTSPIFVEKGTVVSISYYNLQRHKDLWGADADDFVPDRWSTYDPSSRAYWYLPFGAGARQCIGRDKALAEALFVLARLLQRFEGVESRDDSRPWQGKVALSAQNVHGCVVGFTAA